MHDPAGGLNAGPIDLVGRLPLQIAWGLFPQWTRRPGIGPGDLGVVAPSQTAGGNRDKLPVHVANALVAGRARDDETILCRAVGRVILEEEARALALGVNFPRANRSRCLCGGPVEAIEPDDEHILGPSCDCVFLHPVKVALVGVNGLWVDGVRGHDTVRGPDLLGVTIAAVRSHYRAKVGLAPVDIHSDQPVGVAGVVGEGASRPLRTEMESPGLFLAGRSGIPALQRLEHVGNLDLRRLLSPELDRPGRSDEEDPEYECPRSRTREVVAANAVNRTNENSQGRHSGATLLTRARRACGSTGARTTAHGTAGSRAARRDSQYAESRSRIPQETAKKSISRASYGLACGASTIRVR